MGNTPYHKPASRPATTAKDHTNQPEAHPVDVMSHQYLAGQSAFNRGILLDACPYMGSRDSRLQESWKARIAWMTGWLDQRTRIVHRQIWQRWGIEV